MNLYSIPSTEYGTGTDNVMARFLAIAEHADDTRTFNTDVDDSALAAESGIITDRDADAIWALQQDAEDDAEDECEWGLEPVSGYDGELNDRFERVCYTHGLAAREH